MKERRSFFRVISVLLFLLLSCELISCSGGSAKSGEKDEILEYFRNKMTETLPLSSETVYWSKNGSVYHLFDDCRFLERTDEVRHGTVAQSGRSRLCGECAKRSERSEHETEGAAEDSVTVPESISVTSDTAVSQTADETVPSESTAASTEVPPPVTQAPNTSHPESESPPGIDIPGALTPDSENKAPAVVYWTPNGSVWHADAGCPSLARSKVVNSGTIEQSGKARGCKKCTSAS